MQRVLILFFLFTSLVLSSQRPTKVVPQQPRPKGTESGNAKNFESGDNSNSVVDVEEDSIPPKPFKYTYFHIGNQQKLHINFDTSLNNFYLEVDPAKRVGFNFLNTGNMGSSLLPSIFDFKPFAGFNSGYHQYDYYNFTLDSFRFYNSERPLADLQFSPIFGSQQNFIVGAEFGQKYQGGTGLSVNFKRISQSGLYSEQKVQTTNFAISVHWRFLKNRLSVFPGIISNVNTEQHNGGIIDSFLYVDGFQFRKNVPNNLHNASTRYDYKNLFLFSEYSLDGRSSDSSKILLGHSFKYKYGYNKFSDVDIESDSIFYNKFFVDKRGIRNNLSVSTVSNEFFLKNNWPALFGKLSLIYDIHNVKDEGLQKIINDITLRFDGRISIKKLFEVKTNSTLGLGANAGTFSLNGKSDIKLSKIAILTASFDFFRSQKSWNSEHLYLNFENVYTKDFANPFGSRLKLQINILPIKMTAELGQNVINQYIYIDSFAIPSQDNKILSATYISVMHKLKVWKMVLENFAFVQNSNRDYLPIPSAYLKSNLYFESLMFRKNLLLRLGAELKVMPSFTIGEYDAVLGNYYVGNHSYKKDYQVLDLYILGRISKFRVFFKMENVQDLFRKEVNFLSVNHPQFDRLLRFGFRWLLLD